jgi:hypothetical protein
MKELPLEIRKALNKQKYGWSKWGGPNFGLVQKNLTPEWFCQACKQMQPEELTPYMFEFVEREYIRICSKCHHVRITNDIQPLQFDILIDLVRSC